jgi:hypothetical protein
MSQFIRTFLRHPGLCILLMLNFGAHAQLVENRPLNYNSENLWIVKEVQNDLERVIEAEKLIYYRADFSHLIFWTNDLLRCQFTTGDASQFWCEEFNEVLSKREYKRVENSVRMPVALCEFPPDSSWLKMRYTKSDGQYSPLDTIAIRQCLSAYSSAGNSGVGLIILPECFQANTRIIMVNYIFFDVADKEILWWLQLQAPVRDLETIETWTLGLHSTFFRFRELYLKRKKKLAQIKRKYKMDTIK